MLRTFQIPVDIDEYIAAFYAAADIHIACEVMIFWFYMLESITRNTCILFFPLL